MGPMAVTAVGPASVGLALETGPPRLGRIRTECVRARRPS
jgi:hypothetical protein